MRIAYADPPYPGMAHIYRNHPDFAGEVDHAALVARLENEFDGWALSTSERALGAVLPLCPWDSWEFRVCVWRRVSRPIGRSRIMYAWEPLLVKTPRWDSLPWIADTAFIAQHLGGYRHSIRGQKTREFCFWMFGLLGARAEDEFTDLFPGSGAVGHAWDAWCSQTRLAV